MVRAVGGLPAMGDGLAWAGGLSLALVQVLQLAELLQELGPGVVIVPSGAWAWPQSLLQHQAVGPQERIVGALLSQRGWALRDKKHQVWWRQSGRQTQSGKPSPQVPCFRVQGASLEGLCTKHVGALGTGLQATAQHEGVPAGACPGGGSPHPYLPLPPCPPSPTLTPGPTRPHRALALHSLPLDPLHLPLPGQVLRLHHTCEAQVLFCVLMT